MKVTIRHLSYFAALCQHGHFGLAAQSINVTQPALSVAIKELEEIIGATLIDRSSRPFQPTTHGRDVLQKAHKILTDVESLEQTAGRQRGRDGPFDLGVIPTVAPYLLPKALELIQEQLPRLEIRIREAQTEVLLTELEANQLDACILATPSPNSGLQEQVLFRDRFVLALRQEQAAELGLQDGKVELTDMAPLKLLLLSEGHCLREQAQDLCRFATQEVLNQIGASSLQTLAGLATSGYGATLMPEIALDDALLSGSLAILRLAAPEPDRAITLVSKRHPKTALDLAPLAHTLAQAGSQCIAQTRAQLGP
ncbi:Hydrogen peroxide-inducible genes activator [Roseovarius albus]|uniref:Hydrogen peroxide-inducible genes activator n=1 Tax=Roseovarius albus TaxID=1247867 RepID=A0A1X6ZXR7_9RHOB|nr:hydrogen peroxide-inducible genes activator [Roseovarius albus]SLN64611.1 Hydrogen peroxide-inducible genes activator [Roseovarius albus]